MGYEPLPVEPEEAHQPLIVVVASESDVRKMLVLALQVECQGEIIGVSSGAEAVKVIAQFKPSLVVISSQPFDLAALPLAQQLHALAGCEHMPVILTQPVAQGSSESQPPRLVFLLAPFTIEALYAAVHRCLEGN